MGCILFERFWYKNWCYHTVHFGGLLQYNTLHFVQLHINVGLNNTRPQQKLCWDFWFIICFVG